MTAYEKAENEFLQYLATNQSLRAEWLSLLEQEVVNGKTMEILKDKWNKIMQTLINELDLKDDEDFGPTIP